MCVKVTRHPPLQSNIPWFCRTQPPCLLCHDQKFSEVCCQIEGPCVVALQHLPHFVHDELWSPAVLGRVRMYSSNMLGISVPLQKLWHFFQKSTSFTFLSSFFAQLFEELVDVVPLFIFLLLVVGRHLGQHCLYKFQSKCETSL